MQASHRFDRRYSTAHSALANILRVDVAFKEFDPRVRREVDFDLGISLARGSLLGSVFLGGVRPDKQLSSSHPLDITILHLLALPLAQRPWSRRKGFIRVPPAALAQKPWQCA